MDFGALLTGVHNLFQSHIAAGVTIIVAAGLLFYFKPKPMLKLVATLLVFVFACYAFSMLGEITSTGYSEKIEMANGTDSP